MENNKKHAKPAKIKYEEPAWVVKMKNNELEDTKEAMREMAEALQEKMNENMKQRLAEKKKANGPPRTLESGQTDIMATIHRRDETNDSSDTVRFNIQNSIWIENTETKSKKAQKQEGEDDWVMVE